MTRSDDTTYTNKDSTIFGIAKKLIPEVVLMAEIVVGRETFCCILFKNENSGGHGLVWDWTLSILSFIPKY